MGRSELLQQVSVPARSPLRMLRPLDVVVSNPPRDVVQRIARIKKLRRSVPEQVARQEGCYHTALSLEPSDCCLQN